MSTSPSNSGNGTSCIPEQLRAESDSRESKPAVTADSAPKADAASNDRPSSSIFARTDDAPVHIVPMRVIHRPLPSELDESKVQAFMEEMKMTLTFQAGDVFTPIEVVKVRAPLKSDPTGKVQNFYFAMGGCHRYEATKRLGLESIRAKIIEVPASNMRIYMGAGCPF